MKKLFFAALVATVAVGGALSANAINVYTIDPDGSGPLKGTLIDCNQQDVTCTSLQGTVYNQASFPQTLVQSSDLVDTYRD